VDDSDAIPEAFQPVTPELVDRLRGDMLKAGFPETLAELISTYLVETGPAYASCPHCRRRVIVDLPVQKYREKIVDKLVDHLVGKPLEKRQVDHRIHTVADLGTLTDDELYRIASGAS
jgi:hypothetical protein